MELIHCGGPTEIVVPVTPPHHDLWMYNELLFRRIAVFDAAVRDALRKIAQERHLTIYVGDDTEVTNTPDVDPYNGYPLEYSVLQEAHDRAYEFIPEGQGW